MPSFPGPTEVPYVTITPATDIAFKTSNVPEDATFVTNPPTEESTVTPEEGTTEAVTASPSTAGGSEEPAEATILATTPQVKFLQTEPTTPLVTFPQTEPTSPLVKFHQTEPPVVATAQAEGEVHATEMSTSNASPTDEVILLKSSGS